MGCIETTCAEGFMPVCSHCLSAEFAQAEAPYTKFCRCAPVAEGGCGRLFTKPYCMTELQLAELFAARAANADVPQE